MVRVCGEVIRRSEFVERRTEILNSIRILREKDRTVECTCGERGDGRMCGVVVFLRSDLLPRALRF